MLKVDHSIFIFKMNLIFISFFNINFCRILESIDTKITIIWVSEQVAKYILLIIKYISFIPTCILVDLTSYETDIPVTLVKKNTLIRSFFISKFNRKFSIFSTNRTFFNSCEDLFLNANWMERECSEMSYLSFSNKYDLRNLLLPYFENFKPLRKVNSSIGDFEIFFNFCSLSLVRLKLYQ